MPNPAVVVCATARLAQTLKVQQAVSQAHAGMRVFVPMYALTLGQLLDWLVEEAALRGLCTGHLCERPVLGSYAERLLWERVIKQKLGSLSETLFDVHSLARAAQEAHHLSVTWELAAHNYPSADEHPEFQEWRPLFLSECANRCCVDPATWQKAVIESLKDWLAHLKLPNAFVFAGFARFNPQEKRLRELFKSHACLGEDWCSAAAHAGRAHVAEPVALAYPDVASEALAAAIWARERLQANPQGRYAVVVPDLAGLRNLLQDTLEDVLVPDLAYPGQAEAARPFNISLGLALARYPLVDSALALLHVVAAPHRVEQSDFSALLRNTFWSDTAHENLARAVLETQLRERVPPSAPLRRFVQAVATALRASPSAHAAPPAPAPCLEAHLNAALALSGQANVGQLPSAWAQQIPAVLQQAGWLYERKLSSHEYQTRSAFLECVGALAGLDALLGEITLAEARGHLQRLCMERTFQPETVGQPRLQVLGLLETSGLNFDAAWVMGMQDKVWPPPARPNPLLPAAAQRQAGVPNASAAIQLAFAQQVHAMLLDAAPEVVFSWARRAGASELNPSPLIPPTPEHQHLCAPVSPHWTADANALRSLGLSTPIPDHIAPAVAQTERVQGGAGLLRAQAICPAWAYYQYRLGAVQLEAPVEGLDARQRGRFLHKSLELFWGRVQNSHALHALSPEARRGLVVEAVHDALAVFDANPRNSPLKPRQRALELERLERLLLEWLQVELQRPQAFTVIAHEREVVVDLKGLGLRMFIDRIDQLEDGSLLVMDYKTGAKVDTDNWSLERLTEPQLPLYASIQPPAEGPVEGVVFAKVLMHDPAWSGLARQENCLPKVMGLESKPGRRLFLASRFPDWDSVLQHWKRCIHALADEIRAGDAGVRFDRLADLRWCGVKPLLRLDERQAQCLALQARPQSAPELAP